ncbi:MAG TPA: tetratricopeptide repeat protein [Candidatus Latescibacteria bacterium]|nr:tetratricopeptide repeat protein [Candidatus Latescibacterota bacterium]
MILAKLLTIAILGTAMSLSTRFFSPVELQDRFEEGQKLYALADYEKAAERYQVILETESNVMINVEEVQVAVDEFILPVRVAATYQLGNTYNKLGLEKLQRSSYLRSEKKDVEAEERYQDALSDLKTSLGFFKQLAENGQVEERTRVMAQYQMIQTSYQLKSYEQVIEEGNALLETFPHSVYEAATYYDMAWSNFELEDFDRAIADFEQVLTLAPRGSNADRSLFQIAESYGRLGQTDQALTYLDRLIGRYDFAHMSEEDLIEMTTLKLKGVVKETARELVAKSHLKKGDIYAEAGNIDAALAAYAVVPLEYAAEPALVQNSYIRAAELIQKERGAQAAIASYKNAIEEVEDKVFQARTQLTVALMLYDEGQYLKAAEEYEIYLSAYPDVTARVGFGTDKVWFRVAQCHQEHARAVRGENEAEATASIDKALGLHEQVLEEYGSSELIPDVLFNAGFANQLKGQDAEALPYYQRLVERYPEHPASVNGLLQLARIEYAAARYRPAVAIYERFVQQHPESELGNTAQMELGLAHKVLKEPDLAIAAYLQVAEAWGQWPSVQVDLAELYIGRGDYDEAKVALGQALARVEDSTLRSQIHYTSARVGFAQDDFELAIREWSQALAASPPPQIQQSSLLARGGAYYEVAKQRDASGDTTAARNYYEASLTDMKALLERDPTPQIKDSAFRTLGACMIRLQRADEAATYYRELISASDDRQEQATFQMLLTELYYDQQNFAQAESFARELLAIDFEDDNSAGYYRKERAYSIIGNALLQQQKYEAAGEAFAEGLKRYPNSGESGNLNFSLGFAHVSGGDYEAAVRVFREFVEAYPDNFNRVHGQYYLAHGLQALTQFKDAAAAFEELAERHPRSQYTEEALFLVGENNYNEQDYATAVEAYQRLQAKYPDGTYSGSAQYALAWSFVEQELMDEAVAAMRTLVARYPRSEFASRAQFTIGDHYYNAQAYEEAMTAYQHVVDDYPESGEAGRAASLISELQEIQASFDYNQAMSLLEGKQYQEAITGLQAIIEKYPGTYTELAAYCNLGLAYEILREWQEAVDNYRVVAERGGDQPENADVVRFAQMHSDWIVENRL